MDREALEHGIVRRLLDHVAAGTTDLADDTYEVPVANYCDEAWAADEREALFHGFPILFALSGALPAPGTYATVDLLGTPILLTRDLEGKVRGFLNVCRHRGVRVMDGAGAQRRYTCPFHAWTYDQTGALTGFPSPDSFAGMCVEDKGLIELPVAEGFGLILGRLRPGDPVDVDEFLGPELSEELAHLDFADWTALGEPHVHAVDANWKTALDTFRENYHFDFLHRTTLAGYAYGGVLTFDPMGPHLRNCSAIRSIDAIREVPEEEWGDVTQHFSYQYQLFPNTTLTFDARHIELWQILPVDARTSVVLHTAYLRPGLSDEERAKATDMAPWICDTVVDGEDFWVAGRTEPGLSTGILESVIFGRNEPALQHLHRNFTAAVEAYRADRGNRG